MERLTINKFPVGALLNIGAEEQAFLIFTNLEELTSIPKVNFREDYYDGAILFDSSGSIYKISKTRISADFNPSFFARIFSNKVKCDLYTDQPVLEVTLDQLKMKIKQILQLKTVYATKGLRLNRIDSLVSYEEVVDYISGRNTSKYH